MCLRFVVRLWGRGGKRRGGGVSIVICLESFKPFTTIPFRDAGIFSERVFFLSGYLSAFLDNFVAQSGTWGVCSCLAERRASTTVYGM